MEAGSGIVDAFTSVPVTKGGFAGSTKDGKNGVRE
jgi:hypothetical protein